MGKPTSPETKATILKAIRTEGVSVTDAAAKYAVTSKSIYRWLNEDIGDKDRNLTLEVNRLRKENEQLYNLLGRATAEMQRSKN